MSAAAAAVPKGPIATSIQSKLQVGLNTCAELCASHQVSKAGKPQLLSVSMHWCLADTVK
jgi:hypothetical protein